jgi:hypothetical protein
MGGGKLYSMNIGSLAQTPITQGGSTYVVPSETVIEGFQIANSLVQGAGFPTGTGTGEFGLLIDLGKNQIITTAPSTSTTLIPFY